MSDDPKKREPKKKPYIKETPDKKSPPDEINLPPRRSNGSDSKSKGRGYIC